MRRFAAIGQSVHDHVQDGLGDRPDDGCDAAAVRPILALNAHRGGRAGADRRGAGPDTNACLEPHQVTGGSLEEGRARRAGQLVRIGGSEDRARLAGGERLQTDPVGEVGLQPAEPALVEPLAGEQQMHAERPSDPADRHEQLREVGMLAEQFGELVDDDQQRGQRRKVGASASRAAS